MTKKKTDGWQIATSLAALGSRLFVINAVPDGEYPAWQPILDAHKRRTHSQTI